MDVCGIRADRGTWHCVSIDREAPSSLGIVGGPPAIPIELLAVIKYSVGAVQYLCRTPAPPLDTCVERLWLLVDAPAHSKERIAASGTIDLGINLHENQLRIYDPGQPARSKRFSGAVVSGTHSRPFVIDPRELVSVIGVRFRTGGAFPFLGTPASELANTHVDLDVLWGTSATELRERLCAGKTPEERFNLLEKTLMAHLFRPLERHCAVRFALDTFGRPDPGVAIRDVARDAGLSQRRFIQIFAREVGMSPKLFLSCPAFSASARNSATDRRCARLGSSGGGLWVLRPIASDSRLSIFLEPEPDGIYSSTERMRDAKSRDTGRVGQFFPIRDSSAVG
jgi:AraC-like DNA-binding protein